MASVEITEQTVRSQAGEDAFESGRSLADRGLVDAVTVEGRRVGAHVEGTATNLLVTTAGLGANCAHTSCAAPAPQLCEHAVAVALTWLRSGRERREPNLLAVLRTKDSGWLAAKLAELAVGDPALTSRLLEAAGGPDALVIQELRDDIASVVAELTAERDDGDDYGFDEWYPDTEELEEVLDDIEGLLEEAPDAVVDITEDAIRLLEEVLEDGCSGGDLPDALARAADLHLDACRAGAPDPVALAGRLLAGALRSGWGTFDNLVDYADVLGPEGLNRYGELLERERAAPGGNGREPYKLRKLREGLARAQGGTDAVVEFLARTASRSWDFVHIADVLIGDGRDDDALVWITKGLSDEPANSRLLSLALDCHRRAGRDVDAMEVLWTRFATAPTVQTYVDLTDAAGQDATWRARAMDLLRARTAEHADLLVRILLRQDDVPAAWGIVQNHRVDHDLRMRVLEAHARTHPEDAIPFYRDLAETHIRRGSRPGYEDAIRCLLTARNLAGRCGRELEHSEFVARLRAAHPGKKLLQQLLDQAGFNPPG